MTALLTPRSFHATRRGKLVLLPDIRTDLLGRRRVLVTATALFATPALVGGLALNAGKLVGAAGRP